MTTIQTPTYGYLPADCEYTQFWRQHDKAAARKRATNAHLKQQAAIIRRRGGSIKRTDKQLYPDAETVAHLKRQAAIIKSTSWAYRSYSDYPDSSCKACRTANDRLMHNCV